MSNDRPPKPQKTFVFEMVIIFFMLLDRFTHSMRCFGWNILPLAFLGTNFCYLSAYVDDKNKKIHEKWLSEMFDTIFGDEETAAENLLEEEDKEKDEKKQNDVSKKNVWEDAFHFERIMSVFMFMSWWWCPYSITHFAWDFASVGFLFTNFAYFVLCYLSHNSAMKKPQEQKIKINSTSAGEIFELGTQENKDPKNVVRSAADEVEKAKQEIESKEPEGLTNQAMLEIIQSKIDSVYEKMCNKLEKKLKKMEDKYEEDHRKWEEEKNNLTVKLCAATASSEFNSSLFRECEEKRNELITKLHTATATTQLYHVIIEDFYH